LLLARLKPAQAMPLNSWKRRSAGKAAVVIQRRGMNAMRKPE